MTRLRKVQARRRSPHVVLRWTVSVDGYNWVQKEDEHGEPLFLLTDGVPVGVRRQIRVYQPFATPALFLEFAAVEPTVEDIPRFANRYGLLGDAEDWVDVPLPDQAPERALGRGESLAVWHHEIFAMREAVRLWRLVSANDGTELGRYIRWDEGPESKFIVYRSNPDEIILTPPYSNNMEVIASTHEPGVYQRFTPGDPFKPALWYVQRVINRHLHGRVSPRMLWNSDETELEMHLVPHSLIGALWLQFSHAVTGEREYRECVLCKTPFELSPQAARTNRVFCSNACKTKAYRLRLFLAEEKGVSTIKRALQAEFPDATVEEFPSENDSRLKSRTVRLVEDGDERWFTALKSVLTQWDEAEIEKHARSGADQLRRESVSHVTLTEGGVTIAPPSGWASEEPL